MAKRNSAQSPDFLGIGVQRSGTTWLYENLKLHPEIWLTPIKEIHYFDKLDKEKLATSSYRKHSRKRAFFYLKSIMQGAPITPRDLSWDYNYFFRSRDIEWYKRLFCPPLGQIAGEITPAYSFLNKNIVQDIYKNFPEVKVILLLRNPIKRDWSSAIKKLARDRKMNPKTITNAEFIKRLNSKGVLIRGNYLRTLEIWESTLPKDQIFIGFMEEIQRTPELLLKRIYGFLEVSETIKHISPDLRRKKNSTDGYKIPIPSEIEKYLAIRHLPQLEILSERFGGYTLEWLDYAREVIERED